MLIDEAMPESVTPRQLLSGCYYIFSENEWSLGQRKRIFSFHRKGLHLGRIVYTHRSGGGG